jgi:hypothetical protein
LEKKKYDWNNCKNVWKNLIKTVEDNGLEEFLGYVGSYS